MRKFNFIYSKLVKDDNDFVGIMAYSLYKQQKIKHIQDFKKRHNNDPSDDELEEFHRISSTEDNIKGYKSRATELINNFSNLLLEEKRKEIEQYYLNESPLKPKGWWYGMFQSFMANIFYAFFLALIAVLIWASKTDLLSILKKLLNG